MRRGLALGVLLVTGLVAGCGARGAAADPSLLALTAYEAWGEARSQARGWDASAQLQYVEGASVTNTGVVLPDAGYWRFVYRAPGRSQQYAVTVSPTTVAGEERTPQSPPGYVIGDATLGTDWIDSPQAIEAGPSFGAETRVHLFLIPTTPPRWTWGDVEIDARTGAVIP